MTKRLPEAEAVALRLAAHLGLRRDDVTVSGIEELTPGLSGGRVFRVRLSLGDGATLRADRPPYPHEAGGAYPCCSVVLKIPDWGGRTGIAPRDPQVAAREVRFYEAGVAARLPEGIRAPHLVGIDRVAGSGTWLWTEDVRGALRVAWTARELLVAAERAALFHRLFREYCQELEHEPWLEREGYAAHAHHVPAAHRRLDGLDGHPLWGSLFTPNERAALHRALDRAAWAASELRRLPQTLVHGDFHVQNLGFDPPGSSSEGTLVGIDWAHVGLAPLGSDVATLISLYTGMGGRGDLRPGGELEQAALEAYCAAVERAAEPDGGLQGAPLREAVRRARGLWHLTWGLDLRLGPGLDWLLRRPDQTSPEAAAEAASIREGGVRALAFLPPLGGP